MVHWIYIVECDDQFIYVGETLHLYKRLKQHISGRGGKNTHAHIPKKLIGLYKVNDNFSYHQYLSAINNNVDSTDIINTWGLYGDNLFIENNFTERLFYERRNNHEYGIGNEWYRVRGGKYTRNDLDASMHDAMELCERPNRIVGTLQMTTPIDRKTQEEIVDRPLCNCGMPSEVILDKDKNIYFICALRNVWNNLYSIIQINKPCIFHKLKS